MSTLSGRCSRRSARFVPLTAIHLAAVPTLAEAKGHAQGNGVDRGPDSLGCSVRFPASARDEAAERLRGPAEPPEKEVGGHEVVDADPALLLVQNLRGSVPVDVAEVPTADRRSRNQQHWRTGEKGHRDESLHSREFGLLFVSHAHNMTGAPIAQPGWWGLAPTADGRTDGRTGGRADGRTGGRAGGRADGRAGGRRPKPRRGSAVVPALPLLDASGSENSLDLLRDRKADKGPDVGARPQLPNWRGVFWSDCAEITRSSLVRAGLT
jgi:hypothetical protein